MNNLEPRKIQCLVRIYSLLLVQNPDRQDVNANAGLSKHLTMCIVWKWGGGELEKEKLILTLYGKVLEHWEHGGTYDAFF